MKVRLPYPQECLFPLALLIFFSIASKCKSSVEEFGYLEPGRSVKISSAEPGVLQSVVVSEGALVKEGDVLARLDTRVLELDAKIASEEFALLERRLIRLRELLPKKFASEDELLRAESELVITKLRKERIQAQIERLTLRSPIDGVITEIRFDEAESVPGPNSHVFTVVQLSPMKVRFTLPLVEAAKLQPGQLVVVEFPDYAQTATGKVEFISPVSAAVVNTVRVNVQIPDAGGLPAGIKCRLQPQTQLSSSHQQPAID